MSHLWDAFFAGMAATGMPPTGPLPELFGLSLRYPAAAGLLADVVAIELLPAHDVLAVMPTRPTLGAGTGAAFKVIEEAVAAVTGDRSPARAHAAVRAGLADVARQTVA